MHLRKRTVHFYELKAESFTRTENIANPSTAGLPALLECFGKFTRAKAIEIERSKNISVELADWNHDPVHNCYEILINKADALLSDVTLRHLKTRAVRKAGKQKIEGIESSSHIIIRPNPDGVTALVLMTMGAGISIQTIEKFFRNMAKLAHENPANKSLFYFSLPSGSVGENGRPLTYRVVYKFIGLAHKGQTLVHALETGHFESMELVAHKQDLFDAGGNLQIEHKSIMVKASGSRFISAGSLKSALNRFTKQKDNDGYDTARIQYKNSSGAPRTATLALNALDAAFTHNEIIEFDTDVEAQQTALSPTVIQAMKECLA